MALSGTVNTGNYQGRYLSLTWTATQNIANNTSTIKWTLKGAGNATSSWYRAGPFQVTINGVTTTIAATSPRLQLYNGTVVKTGSTTITHNADGTKSFSISVKGAIYSASYNNEGSGTFTLNTIPRASTFTRSGTATMGNAQTITITRATSSFTHKLYYTWAGTKTLIASNVGTSYTWTPAVSMATKIPNATSGSCTLTCETYSGSTLVGTKTLSFTLSVPASVVPTISAFTLTEANEAIKGKFSAFVNSQSKIAYSVTAAGAQSSTIKSYSVSIVGQSFAKSSGTTAVIAANYAGTHKANVTVTDSRGRTASKTVDFTVFAYAPPKFTAFSAQRCNADGTLNDDGEYLSLTVGTAVAAVNNENTVAYELYYKKTSDSEYTKLAFSGSGYSYNGTTVFTSPTFSVDNSFNIRFQITDAFATITRNETLSSAKPILDILPDGSGMAAGKVAEKAGVFDFGFQALHTEGVTAPLLEKGTNFDDIRTPNIYNLLGTAEAEYLNCPISTGTASLEVKECGNSFQKHQILKTCSKTNPMTYERFYYSSSWGEWVNTSAFGGNLLWSGAMHMQESHTIALSQKISEQPNGIVLVFSEYEGGAAKDYMFQHKFIPKYIVAAHSGVGHCIILCNNTLNVLAAKYLYISNDSIKGHANNASTGTATSGVVYTNNRFVLRYVIGV